MTSDDQKLPVCGLAVVPGSAARIADLKRRLRNARQRALFWSGNPTFTGKRFNTRRSRGDEGYELAMCDIRSLSDHIEELTGRRPKQSDPKRAFRERFAKLMSAVASQRNIADDTHP